MNRNYFLNITTTTKQLIKTPRHICNTTLIDELKNQLWPQPNCCKCSLTSYIPRNIDDVVGERLGRCQSSLVKSSVDRTDRTKGGWNALADERTNALANERMHWQMNECIGKRTNALTNERMHWQMNECTRMISERTCTTGC